MSYRKSFYYLSDKTIQSFSPMKQLDHYENSELQKQNRNKRTAKTELAKTEPAKKEPAITELLLFMHSTTSSHEFSLNAIFLNLRNIKIWYKIIENVAKMSKIMLIITWHNDMYHN